MHEIGFILGIVIVYLITLLLKKIIKQPRPSTSLDDYGMPSSSSAVVTFAVVYICLVTKKYWLIGLLVILTTVYLKNYLEHHTFPQTLVGSIIGGVCAVLMFFYGIRASITLIMFCISRVYKLLPLSSSINFDLDNSYVSKAFSLPLLST